MTDNIVVPQDAARLAIEGLTHPHALEAAVRGLMSRPRFFTGQVYVTLQIANRAALDRLHWAMEAAEAAKAKG